MHILLWVLTGLVIGAVARFTRHGRDVSRLAVLALGGLGSVVGGWAADRMVTSQSVPAQVGAALLGALAAFAGAWLLRWVSLRPAARTATHALGALEQQLLGKLAHRKPVARDANRTFDEQLTLGERMADRLASFGGSWLFLGIFAALLLAWMIYNTERSQPFDPYPFILLNLVLSCLAAVQAPVIMMSQNRQNAKDRLGARLDYEVNLKAEFEILALHEKVDLLREKAWGDLLILQERQLALLERIARALPERLGPGAS